MTLSDWVVLATFGFMFASYRMQRAVRRVVRRHVRRRFRRGLAGVIGVWLWRRLRSVVRSYRLRSRPRPPVLSGDDMYRACPMSRWAAVARCDPATCRWCGARLDPRRRQFCGPQCEDEAMDNHHFARGRRVVLRRDRYQCVRCRRSSHLEVNHKHELALGRHREPGCVHHLDNLETLCGGGGRSCHQAETNRQRRAGAFRRRAA